jgi:hypothetical protein
MVTLPGLYNYACSLPIPTESLVEDPLPGIAQIPWHLMQTQRPNLLATEMLPIIAFTAAACLSRMLSCNITTTGSGHTTIEAIPPLSDMKIPTSNLSPNAVDEDEYVAAKLTAAILSNDTTTTAVNVTSSRSSSSNGDTKRETKDASNEIVATKPSTNLDKDNNSDDGDDKDDDGNNSDNSDNDDTSTSKNSDKSSSSSTSTPTRAKPKRKKRSRKDYLAKKKRPTPIKRRRTSTTPPSSPSLNTNNGDTIDNKKNATAVVGTNDGVSDNSNEIKSEEGANSTTDDNSKSDETSSSSSLSKFVWPAVPVHIRASRDQLWNNELDTHLPPPLVGIIMSYSCEPRFDWLYRNAMDRHDHDIWKIATAVIVATAHPDMLLPGVVTADMVSSLTPSDRTSSGTLIVQLNRARLESDRLLATLFSGASRFEGNEHHSERERTVVVSKRGVYRDSVSALNDLSPSIALPNMFDKFTLARGQDLLYAFRELLNIGLPESFYRRSMYRRSTTNVPLLKPHQLQLISLVIDHPTLWY